MSVPVDVLAVARVTKLVVDDEITRPLRQYVNNGWPDSQLNYLVNCPACVSVWAGLAVQVLPKPVRYALALSQTTLLSKWIGEVTEAAIRR